jgi:hypothetical protein
MDEQRSRTPEELTQDLLRAYLASDSFSAPQIGAPLENPSGMLAEFERWGAEHGHAAEAMTRIAVDAAMRGSPSLPIAALLTDLMECALAFEQLTDQSVDAFLRLRAPRVYTAPNGTTKWALPTPVTDRVALTREVLARTSPRSHQAKEPPSVGMHLAEGHHPEQLRDAMGLRLRDALDLTERSANDVAPTLYSPIIGMLQGSSPELSEMIQWLVSNDPRALMEMPTSRVLLDAVQGNVDPRAEMQLRFAHLIEIPNFGFCAFVMWDTDAHLNRKERAALAGYIRRLADTAVAPWNSYPDLRRRREGFAVWVRQLRDERLEAERLAQLLRSAHPSDYAGEPIARTIKRIYRISSDLSSVRLSPSLAEAVHVSRDQ